MINYSRLVWLVLKHLISFHEAIKRQMPIDIDFDDED